jgi:hypothetical protein
MWLRLAALALLLCAGCEASDFYRQDTHSWFATPPRGTTTDIQP